ncbi:MAG: DUF2807 domain-containing protein [Mucinivorans sp.]
MRNIFFSIILILVSFSVAAQEKLDINVPFSAIDIRGSVEVTIFQTTDDDTATRATLNLLDGLRLSDVKCEVKKGCLNVDAERGLLERRGVVKLEIHVPSLTTIYSKGAIISTDSCLTSENLTVETLGAENTITLNVEVKNLIVNSSGASDIVLTGRVDQAVLNSKLTGRIDMLHCVTTSAYCKVSEASEIYIFALDLLDTKATTMGTIYYMGDPTLKVKNSLWGKVISLKEYASKNLQ